MIRTVVCEKEGCSGKIFWSSPQTSVSFSIESEDGRLKLICKNCLSEYYLDTNYYDFIMLSICSKCNNDGFKIYRDTESNNVYLKCSKCGSPPEKIYIDVDGNQISYEMMLKIFYTKLNKGYMEWK